MQLQATLNWFGKLGRSPQSHAFHLADDANSLLLVVV